MSSPKEASALPAGFRLFHFDDIDSTNAEALRRIRDGGTAGDVVLADRQDAGRGRRGRSWQSPPGNVYMTLIAGVPAGQPAGQLAFVAALAAGEAVRETLPTGQTLNYKWPNDLMLDGAKLGGILIEGARDLFAIGIGINLAHAPDGLQAASLAQAGGSLSPDTVAAGVCCAFHRWHGIWAAEGFAPLRTAWLCHAHRLNEPIEARFPDGTSAAGLFADIDRDGALVLLRQDGSTRTIATGEVFFAAA